MKRKTLLGILLGMIMIFGLAGCENEAGVKDENNYENIEETEEPDAEEEFPDEKAEDNADAEADQEKAVPDEDEENQEELLENKTDFQMQKIIYYRPNENADGLIQEETELEEVSADVIIAILIGDRTIPEDVSVLDFAETEVDGEAALNLDLSFEFQKYIMGMGTAGENVVMGSLVNSFLDTFEAEKILITCEGQTLESGHVIYDKYMSRYLYD